ncbi:unnamed protein product [Closterium sp. NIES-64]|nr:unnamed protein product [Closterium sp. NIES-64]
MRASHVDSSSASTAARTFDPTEYALRRREQIERARELRAARSTMMGTGVSRMNTGPTLTRSLSSDNVAGPFAHHASRSYTDSRRNSLGLSSSSSGPLAARRISGATTHGGNVPRTISSSSTNSNMSRSLDTSVVSRPNTSTIHGGHPSTTGQAASSRGSGASAGRSDARQGIGRQQKQRQPNERQRPVDIRQTLKLDDEALFSEEELAAFRCAGMAAESEAAIGVQPQKESVIESNATAAEVAPPVVVEIVDHETGVLKTPPRDTSKKRIVAGEETKEEMPQLDDKVEKGLERNLEEKRKEQPQQQSNFGEDTHGFQHSTAKDQKRREANSHKDECLLLTAPAAASVRGSRVHDERRAMEDSVVRKHNAVGGGSQASGAAQQGTGPGTAAPTTPQSAEKKGGRLLRKLSASVSLLKRAFMGSASFSATSPSASASSPSAAAAATAAAANALAGHAKHETASRASAWTSGKPSALAATHHGTNGSSSSSVASGTSGISGTTGTSGTSRTEGTSWTSGTNGTSGTTGGGTATGAGATSVSGTPNLVTPTRTLHTINTPSAFNPAPSPLAADVTPRTLFHSITATAAATGFSAVVSAGRAPLSASTAPSTPQYGLPRTAQGSTSASASPHSGAFVPAPWDSYGASSVPASPAASEGASGGGQSRRKRWASIGGGHAGGSFLVLGGMSAERVDGTSRGGAAEGAEDGFTTRGRNSMRKQEADSATSTRGMGYASDDAEDSRRKSDRQGRATWSATPGDATPMQIRQMMNAQERKARTNGVGKSTSKGKGRSDRPERPDRPDRVHPEPQATPTSPSAAPPVNHSGGRKQGSARMVGRGAAAAAAVAAGVGRSPGKGGKGSGEDVADDVAAAVRAWARERRGSVSVSGNGGDDVQKQEKMVGVERWLQQRLMDGYSGRAVQAGDCEKKVRKEAVGGESSGQVKKKVGTGSGRVKKKNGAGASAGEEEAAGGETVKGKKSSGGGGMTESGDAYEHSDKENGVKKVKGKGMGNGKGKQKGQRVREVGKASGDEASGVDAAMSERVGPDANGKAVEKRKKKVVKKTVDSVGDEAGDGGEVKRVAKNGATVKKGKKAPLGSKKSDGSGDKGDVSDGEGVGGMKVKKVIKKKRPVGSDSISADQGLLQPNPDHVVSEEKVAHGSSLELAI